MRVLILGGDGYLGWPTAMDLAMKGHEVSVMDNYLRRNIARETCSEPLFENPNLNERAAEFERFDRHVDKLRRANHGNRIDYVSICSPNYGSS